MAFTKLAKLGVLDIAANRFDNIPMCIAGLRSLRHLNVERNYIKAVPIEILRLRSLIKFSFRGNPLVFAEGIDAGADMASLKEICARKVFSTRSSFSDVKALASFLGKARRCSFCGGPYYERVYEYTDAQATAFGTLPVCYRLCSRHFDTKKSKLGQALSIRSLL